MHTSSEKEREAALYERLAEVRREAEAKEAELETLRLELSEIKRREKDIIRDIERIGQPELFN